MWSLVIGHRTQELARHGIILFYTTSTPTITKTTHWCGIHRHRNTFICMFVFCVLFHSLTDFFTLTVTSFVNQIMKYQFKTLATSIGPIIAMSEGNLSAQKYKYYKPFKSQPDLGHFICNFILFRILETGPLLIKLIKH